MGRRREEEILRQLWVPGVDSGCKASIVNGFYLKACDNLILQCVFHTDPHSCICGDAPAILCEHGPSFLLHHPYHNFSSTPIYQTRGEVKSEFQIGNNVFVQVYLKYFVSYLEFKFKGMPVLLFTKSGNLIIWQYF